MGWGVPGWSSSGGTTGSCCVSGTECEGEWRGARTRTETPSPTDGGAEDVRDADRQQRPRVGERVSRQGRTAGKLAGSPSHELSNRPADGPSSQETDR